MAFLDQSFSLDELPVATTGNFEPLPAGWYTATINKAEVKNTKSGTGQYIAIRYDITGPTHQGRVVFGNLNIKNDNVKAAEIGRQQLGEVMRAIGLTRVTDTDQLIGGQLSIKLAVKNDAQYGDSNELKGFKASSSAPTFRAAEGNAAPLPSFLASSPPASPGAASKASPPWGKK